MFTVHAEVESSSQFVSYRMWTGNDLIIMLHYSIKVQLGHVGIDSDSPDVQTS